LGRVRAGSAGNVLLPSSQSSCRCGLPPTCDAARATAAVREALVREPPYGAQVSFDPVSATGGWNAPAFAPWLEGSISRASRAALRAGCSAHRLWRDNPVHGMLVSASRAPVLH